MRNTYTNCRNLTGNPVCGDKVTDMNNAYCDCYNLTGSPVCGNSVTNMNFAYYNCYNLTGGPACGLNVINMAYAYKNCRNLSGNGYFYSPNVRYAVECFYNRNRSAALSLYVPSNSTTLTTCLINNYSSIVGSSIAWTNAVATNGCYYNTSYNIYIYPVSNVAEARVANGD